MKLWRLGAVLLVLAANGVRADEPTKTKTADGGGTAPAAAPAAGGESAVPAPDTTAPKDGKAMADPPGFTRLGKTHDVWMSAERKMVIADGRICLRQGPLEMFACPSQSKEHESVVAVNSDAMTVHAALLAVGAKTGNPVQFAPKFVPAAGTRVDIMVLWTDKEGKRHQVPAQTFIRNTRTKKALESSWVFAGSGFFVDEETKKRYYQADGGDLVCVSNFPTATLDLPVESSTANADLSFEALTENIPPVGTRVRLVFIPRFEAPKP